MDKMVNEKIAFLNKYTLSSEKKVEFVTDESTILNAPIPEYWKVAFLTDNLEDRKSAILGEWRKYLARELSNGYNFGFHISIFKGLVELIWVVRDSQNKVILGTPLMEFSRRLISPDYRIMDLVIANYDDFENVMKIAFGMYEDFKQAFMKIAAED